MKSIIVAGGLVLVAASAFAAQVPTPPMNEVPEIDALSGLAALAAVGGGLALFWERRRRK